MYTYIIISWMVSLNLFNCFEGYSKSLMCISPKTRQKYNKENRKSLIIKDFRFLLRDSVGIREGAVFYSKILCFTILFVSG